MKIRESLAIALYDDMSSNPMETAYNRYCDSDRYLENQHRSFTEGWKACIQYLFKGEK